MNIILTGQILLKHNISKLEYGIIRLKMLKCLLYNADVIFSNFESAIQYSNSNKKRNTIFQHDVKSDILDIVKFLGFNVLATSNNHTGDLGSSGFDILHEEFNKRKIIYVGSGKNIHEASAPKYIKTENGIVGFIAVASKIPNGYEATYNKQGVFHLELINNIYLKREDYQRVLCAIYEAKKYAKYVILYHHNHYDKEIEPWRQTFAKCCIDAGVDIYMAHGMPYLMGIEIYKECPIFYGLGNLYFQTSTPDNYYYSNVWESVIVRLKYSANYINIILTPIILNEYGDTSITHFESRGQPSLCDHPTGNLILHKIIKMSSIFGTNIIINNNQGQIIIQRFH